MDKLLLNMNPPGDVRLEVLNVREAIFKLFGGGMAAITKHWKNNFECGELEEFSVVSKMETTAADLGTNCTRFLDLRAILSPGFRLKSNHANFRNLGGLALRALFEFSNLNESIIEANG